MRNRASTHLLLLLLIVGFEIVGYVAVYDSALLRGYEPSVVGAVRDLLLYVPLIFLLFWLSRVMRFRGNWTLFTSAVLLFSIGLLVQYRLYSDPEYGSGSKAEARAEKTQVQRLRFINQFYGADKKEAMGLDPSAAQPSATPEIFKRSEVSVGRALTSSFTWIPLFAFFAMALSYWLCVEDKYLDWMQRQSFIIVLATLVPLFGAVVWSRAGKFGGNMTPWEPSKIPFLVGFATTFKHMFKKANTVNYPAEKIPVFPKYRGKQVLMRDENGLEKCVACGLQRRVRYSVPRRRPALAAAPRLRRLARPRRHHPHRRRAPARRAGESPDAHDARHSGARSPARPHQAAIPSLARRLRPAVAGR